MMCDAPSVVSSDANSKKRSLQDFDTPDSKKQCTEPDRVKKRKVALLLAYSGQGYLGMQRLVILHQCNMLLINITYRLVGLRPSIVDIVADIRMIKKYGLVNVGEEIIVIF